MPLHGRNGARLHHKDAGGALGHAAVQFVQAFAAQRAAAHQGVAVFQLDVGELQQLADGAALFDDVIARVLEAADGHHGFDERQSGAGHPAQAPDIVQAHDAHALGIFLAGDGLDHQGIDAGRILGRHRRHLDIMVVQAHFLGHGQENFFRRGKAAQHFQAGLEIVQMGEQHGLGPGHARVRIQAVDDQGLAVLAQGTGVQAQAFENQAQFRAALRQGKQIQLVPFHGFGGQALFLVGLHGLHKDAALVYLANAAENGRKGVALERRGMHGQAHARMDQGFLGHPFHQLETLAVQAHQARLWPGAETLRHPIQQMETRVVQHLE